MLKSGSCFYKDGVLRYFLQDLEHEKHSDSSHAVRMRVVQRMESDHLFSSYSFLGLPELGILIL